MSDDETQSIYRILDASANRAGEGLRTMEEFARFSLDDAELSSALKSLRHDLTGALGEFPRDRLLAARDTEGDVGTEIGQDSEYLRPGVADVVAAAASRTQQSLRVLEEYGKTISPAAAKQIEQVRYRCYTAAAKLEMELRGNVLRERLERSHLYVLVDACESESAFCELVQTLIDSSVDVIQLRDSSVDDRTLLSRARAAIKITRAADSLFIVNDRPDIAAAADADGIHVGQEEIPVVDARQIVGPNRLIGLSTHSIEQARESLAVGADYIGCGPVFPGRTKSFDSYVGVDFLREVAAEISLPAFAIGGIDAANVDQVIEAGVNRIAVTGAVRDANDPKAAAIAFKEKLTGSNAN